MTDKETQASVGVASVLNAELGLLKDIINRVADELNLPTENGNRVHDLQFWLDSPKIEVDNETLKKAAANMIIGIPESDEEFMFRKPEIISEVIDAVAGMLGWRKNTKNVCPNCETAMPLGCGGIFKKDGQHCLLNKT